MFSTTLNKIRAIGLLLLAFIPSLFVASNCFPIPDSPVGVAIRFTDVASKAGVAFRHTRDDLDIPVGGGAAVGDYNGDGLLDIYVTNSAGSNVLYRNNGDGTFADVALSAGVDDPKGHGNGAGWGDYDNDGDLDLFVGNFGSSKLFRNDGDGAFSDVTALTGIGDPNHSYRTSGVAWGDYDQDGHLDLLVARHLDELGFDPYEAYIDLSERVRPLALYRNNGDGSFTNVTSFLGEPEVYPYHSGTFVNVSLLGDANGYPLNVKGAGYTPKFMDYDNDGDPDIYVANDFGMLVYPNVLWRNDGPDGLGGWEFTDVSTASGTSAPIYGMGLAVGDYDNDEDLDFYMTDIGTSEFMVNQGDGTFVNMVEETGTGRGTLLEEESGREYLSVGWATLFADLDNDGLLDLYYVGGYLDHLPQLPPEMVENHPNAVFQNRGDGTFTDVSAQSGANDPGVGREGVAADLNDDGLIDLFVVNIGKPGGILGTAKLFQNVSVSSNNWLKIKAIGTTSNRDGIGARITVTTGGITRIREMGASQGHMSHSVVPVHFGLGPAEEADVVAIRWPSCIVQTLTHVAVNQLLAVTEPAGEASYPCL